MHGLCALLLGIAMTLGFVGADLSDERVVLCQILEQHPTWTIHLNWAPKCAGSAPLDESWTGVTIHWEKQAVVRLALEDMTAAGGEAVYFGGLKYHHTMNCCFSSYTSFLSFGSDPIGSVNTVGGAQCSTHRYVKLLGIFSYAATNRTNPSLGSIDETLTHLTTLRYLLVIDTRMTGKAILYWGVDASASLTSMPRRRFLPRKGVVWHDTAGWFAAHRQCLCS